MRVRNTGAADRLLAASAPATSSIELNTHRHLDGTMRMERVDGVDVPAGGAVEFKPGGLHLMMFDFAPTGDVVPVKLTFDRGGEATVPLKVMARSAGEGETGHTEQEDQERQASVPDFARGRARDQRPGELSPGRNAFCA